MSKGRDANPYRFSFLQLIGVSETDAEAEDIRRARRVLLPQAAVHAVALPGDPRLPRIRRAGADSQTNPRARSICASSRLQGFRRSRLRHHRQPKIGARATARRRQAAAHRASPGAPAFRLDADRAVRARTSTCSAREVLPHLADLWDDEWEDRWWPERLQKSAPRPRHGAPRPEPENGGSEHGHGRAAQAPTLAGQGRDRDRDQRQRTAARLSARPVGPARPTAPSSRVSPRGNTVYAPKHPGTSRGDTEAAHAHRQLAAT